MATGTVEPTTAELPSTPAPVSIRCMEPPLPRAQPLSLPNSSAIMALASPPFAR